AHFAGAPIGAREQSAVTARIEHVVVARIGRDVTALTAADVVEFVTRTVAGDAGGGVVLLGAADVIRHVVGGEDVVELPRRVALARPRFAAVDGDVRGAVCCVVYPLR